MSAKKDAERKKFLRLAQGILERKLDELSNKLSADFADIRENESGMNDHADMEDVSGSSDALETTYKIMELESAEIEKIEYALDRLKSGTYGICEDCPKQISIDRLKALPFASLCINCQREQERMDDYYNYR